jgi:hypothetical protein
MRWIKWSGLLLILALPVGALAQGSGSTGPATGHEVTDAAPERPFMVTRSVEGKVTKIDAQNQFIVIEDNKGKRLEFKLGDKLKLKADKKTEFGGKKDIRVSDFEPGQFVRITYLASNNTATELRMIRPPR